MEASGAADATDCEAAAAARVLRPAAEKWLQEAAADNESVFCFLIVNYKRKIICQKENSCHLGL